jgi:hypothetical protein
MMQSPTSSSANRTSRSRPSTDRAVSLEAEVLNITAQREEENDALNREKVARVGLSEILARVSADRDSLELALKRSRELMTRLEAERVNAISQLAASNTANQNGTRAARELAVALDRAQKAGGEALAARDATAAELKKMTILATAARQVANQASAVATAACSERDAALFKVTRLRTLLRRAHEDSRKQGVNLAIPKELNEDD